MKPSPVKDIAKEVFRKYQLHPSVESTQQLADLLEMQKYRYRTQIFKEGDSVTHIYYIERGLVRLTHKDTDGADIVDAFCQEDGMLISNDLFTEKPAVQTATTIEPTFLFTLPYASLQHYATVNRDFTELLCAIFEEHILDKEKYIQLLSQSPQERFETMNKEHSEIIWRSPAKDIASYLRMRPETLSRIRYRGQK